MVTYTLRVRVIKGSSPLPPTRCNFYHFWGRLLLTHLTFSDTRPTTIQKDWMSKISSFRSPSFLSVRHARFAGEPMIFRKEKK